MNFYKKQVPQRKLQLAARQWQGHHHLHFVLPAYIFFLPCRSHKVPVVWYRIPNSVRPLNIKDFTVDDLEDLRRAIIADKQLPNCRRCDITFEIRPPNSTELTELTEELLGHHLNLNEVIRRYNITSKNPIIVKILGERKQSCITQEGRRKHAFDKSTQHEWSVVPFNFRCGVVAKLPPYLSFHTQPSNSISIHPSIRLLQVINLSFFIPNRRVSLLTRTGLPREKYKVIFVFGVVVMLFLSLVIVTRISFVSLNILILRFVNPSFRPSARTQ